MPKIIHNLTIMPVYADERTVSTEVILPSVPDKVAIIEECAGKTPEIIFYGNPDEVFAALNSYLLLSREEHRIQGGGGFRWEGYFNEKLYLEDYAVRRGCGLATE